MFMLSSLRARKLCTLSVLRAHGMDVVSQQTIYRSVVIAKLTYASSAWLGLASTSDLQRLEAFIRRSDRCGFVQANLPTFADLCENADEIPTEVNCL